MARKLSLSTWLDKLRGTRTVGVGTSATMPAAAVLSGLNREDVLARYKQYPVAPSGYATVRDFCDSADHLSPLMLFNGDLKDVQRPWALKVIVATTPPGSHVVEIGGGGRAFREPWLNLAIKSAWLTHTTGWEMALQSMTPTLGSTPACGRPRPVQSRSAIGAGRGRSHLLDFGAQRTIFPRAISRESSLE